MPSHGPGSDGWIHLTWPGRRPVVRTTGGGSVERGSGSGSDDVDAPLDGDEADSGSTGRRGWGSSLRLGPLTASMSGDYACVIEMVVPRSASASSEERARRAPLDSAAEAIRPSDGVLSRLVLMRIYRFSVRDDVHSLLELSSSGVLSIRGQTFRCTPIGDMFNYLRSPLFAVSAINSGALNFVDFFTLFGQLCQSQLPNQFAGG
ncbi:unnamed protein product [Protopolystoma xenopodis]|uniref:Uncharacterized protein n=1 Tax=Protopolystoma xenopodis TaxID=117903 RepID=A0A3S5CTK5_9PLAT|nr:unnamed protein product [Protopolystoma xenopodis]